MLEKLTLRNFQTHKKLEVEFDERVTTIVGPTDSGKSAVLRGLGWVMLNHPSGADFIRAGASSASATLHVGGHSVRRVRGEGENSYHLDRQKYVSLRHLVPEPIANQLNTSSINFQGQLDPPFWFTETAGQVSRNLNQIVNLGKIDKTLSDAAAELRRAKVEAEVSQDRLKAARKERDALEWAVEFDRDLKRLEALEADLAEKDATIASLASNIAEAQRHREALRKASERSLALKTVLDAAAEALRLTEQADKLESLIKEARSAEEKASRENPDTTALDVSRTKADKLAEQCRGLESLIDQAKRTMKEIKWNEKERSKVEKEIEEKSEGRCPACNQLL